MAPPIATPSLYHWKVNGQLPVCEDGEGHRLPLFHGLRGGQPRDHRCRRRRSLALDRQNPNARPLRDGLRHDVRGSSV